MSRAQPQYQPGQLVPGTVYRVHRVIGAGGMGTVYDVEDTTVGKRYVLKTLHASLADRDDLAARLLREARALARMHHPSIVEVITAGTTNDNLRLPFFVMERLNGQSVRQVLARRTRLEIDQALDIAIDLLDALEHAHELGMIHRDVKPDNIFLHRGVDGTSVAKLLDFGIAKVLASQTQHTGGRFIGTFRYASPEQILGAEVTPKSDLYAAALTLYEMIAGRGPFDEHAAEIEIGKAHASKEPPRLSRFAPVPQRLDDLIASALQKDPARRPQNAFAFASVLRELKRSMVTTARPLSTTASTAQPVTPKMDAPRTASTNPYGPPVLDPPALSGATVRIANTLQDGAPPPMTMVPSVRAPSPIDRSAETNAAPPARNDTLLMSPSVAPTTHASPDVSTFAAQTTEATARVPRRAPAVLFAGAALAGALVLGAGLFAVKLRDRPVAGSAEKSAPVISATPSGDPTSASELKVAATAPPVTSTEVKAAVATIAPPVAPVSSEVKAAVATTAPRVAPALSANPKPSARADASAPAPAPAPTPTVKKDPLHVSSGLD